MCQFSVFQPPKQFSWKTTIQIDLFWFQIMLNEPIALKLGKI